MPAATEGLRRTEGEDETERHSVENARGGGEKPGSGSLVLGGWLNEDLVAEKQKAEALLTSHGMKRRGER